MKKLVALVLAALLICNLPLVAFATDTDVENNASYISKYT